MCLIISLFIQVFISTRRCRQLILFILTILSVNQVHPDSDLNYNTGDYQIDCPDFNWINVDASCFRVADQNIYDWNEAILICNQLA